MTIDDSIIEQIKQKANIVDIVGEFVQLTRKGQNHWGICPFHKDTKPSMAVTANKQIFKCFVCGEAGNVFGFIQKYKKISFPEAVKYVGQKVGIDVQLAETAERKIDPEIKELLDVCREAFNFFVYQLGEEEAAPVREYLKKRDLEEDVCTAFGIGYAPNQRTALTDFLTAKGFSLAAQFKAGLIVENEGKFYDAFRDRLIFSIRNENGAVIAFSGRTVGDRPGPKYVNSTGTKIFVKGNVLYNYDRVKNIRNCESVYVLEGFMDVIALHRAGIENAIATMGTAFTKEHLSMLRRVSDKLVLCFDSDAAGQAAAMKAGEQLFRNGFGVDVVKTLPDAKDVDELLQKGGAEAVNKAMKDTVAFILFKYDYLVSMNGGGPDAKQKSLTQIVRELNQVADRNRAVDHGEWLEKQINLASGTITGKLAAQASVPVEPLEESTDARPVKARKARAQLAEDQLLLLMLVHPQQTVPLYREQLGYMNGPVHQEIADTISYLVVTEKEASIDAVKAQVSMAGKLLIDEIMAPVDPVLDKIDREFRVAKVEDYIKIVASVRLENAIAGLVKQNNDPSVSEKTKFENLKKIVELKKKERISDKKNR